MEAILFIVLVLIPVLIAVSLFKIAAKLKETAAQVEDLTRRLAQVELRLSRKETPAPAADLLPVAQIIEQKGSAALVSPKVASTQTATPPAIPRPSAPLPESHAVPPFVNPGSAMPMPASRVPWQIGALNWEQFMGVKLFAWIGGFALFLGIAFFVRYSFERNLIPPVVRVAIGSVVGIGLLSSGVLLKRRELAVTAQTLCATGVVILYSVTFASRSIYHFPHFGPLAAFLVMVLITVTAFTLAVRLNALVVSVLGMLGGFLTPMLLSSGQDRPLALFTYIALLDVGLFAVAFRRRWNFLILMGALGTALMELGWMMKFFEAAKLIVAMRIFLAFDLLFLGAFAAGERWRRSSSWLSASSVGLPFTTLGVVLCLLLFGSLGLHPGITFIFLFGADLCLLCIVGLRPRLQQAQLAAGSLCFLALAVWTGEYVDASRLKWALGFCLFFAVLHTLFPILLVQRRPEARGTSSSHLFPVLALLFMLIPLLKESVLSLWIWPTVFLLDLLVFGVALLTASLAAVLWALILTVGLTAVWLFQIPSELTGLPSLLGIVFTFAVLFFVGGILLRNRFRDLTGEKGASLSPWARALAEWLGPETLGLSAGAQVSALAVILPFLLLIMVSSRMPLLNPSPVFGLAALLLALLLGVALWQRADLLVPISLACLLGLEYAWHQDHFRTDAWWIPLTWYATFYAIYTLLPFAFRRTVNGRMLIWSASALAGPLHFLLFYRAVYLVVPGAWIGFLPAALALPMLLALAYVARSFRPDPGARTKLLAWFGGSALFFITLIFPVALQHQWITVGWALEGLAVIWLFHRVPHPGLRATGVVLLVFAFIRLALNPAVLEYHRNSATPVLNWYLYSYGTVTACLLIGARLLARPHHLVWKRNMPPLLYTLGTILAFLIVNIEIADYFAEGPTLTFQFSGNLARDMVYSMAWAMFALMLLILGIWKRLAAVRYASIGLLLVTLLKLFFHDLSQLGQLYRIGAFLVVAVILMVASFLYQRFVPPEPNPSSSVLTKP